MPVFIVILYDNAKLSLAITKYKNNQPVNLREVPQLPSTPQDGGSMVIKVNWKSSPSTAFDKRTRQT